MTSTPADNEWERFTLTVIQQRQRRDRKVTKTLTVDLSHVIQPMQIQFVVTHGKKLLGEFLEKEGVHLCNCTHENIELSLESSGNVDEVGVQATNLIIKFLLQYDIKPFYMSEDEAETKYKMKEEIKEACQSLDVDIIWKEENNVIWLVGAPTAVTKCFTSLMSFCQGTGERSQHISQESFTAWKKDSQKAQVPVTESSQTADKQENEERYQRELLAIEEKHKRDMNETELKYNQDIQKLTTELQSAQKNENSLRLKFESSEGRMKKLSEDFQSQLVKAKKLEATNKALKNEIERMKMDATDGFHETRKYSASIIRELIISQKTGLVCYDSASHLIPVAQLVGPKPFSNIFSFFSIMVVSKGQLGCIAIGVTPKSYPADRQPGWNRNSIGYHGDDGGIFIASGSPRYSKKKWSVGDVVKCELLTSKRQLTFYKNDEQIFKATVDFPDGGFYPCIGMHSEGECLKLLQKEPWTPNE